MLPHHIQEKIAAFEQETFDRGFKAGVDATKPVVDKQAREELKEVWMAQVEAARVEEREKFARDIEQARNEGRQEGQQAKHREMIADRDKYEAQIVAARVEHWQKGYDARVAEEEAE